MSKFKSVSVRDKTFEDINKLSNESVIRLRKQADSVFLDGMKAADPDIPNWKINTCYYSVRTLGKLGIR